MTPASTPQARAEAGGRDEAGGLWETDEEMEVQATGDTAAPPLLARGGVDAEPLSGCVNRRLAHRCFACFTLASAARVPCRSHNEVAQIL